MGQIRPCFRAVLVRRVMPLFEGAVDLQAFLTSFGYISIVKSDVLSFVILTAQRSGMS